MTKSRGIGMGVGGGRPTKYRESMIKQVDEYLKECVTKYEDYVKTEGDKSTSYQRVIKPNLPKLETLSGILDVDHSNMLEWEKLYPEFHKALDRVRKLQHNMLIEGGLSGDFNPLISKLILSSNHGYKEKSETESNVKIKDTTFTDEEKQKLLDLI